MSQPEKRIGLSVIIPAYNEGARLKGGLETTLQSLEQLGLAYEVVVVDDGSRDETWRVIQEMSGRFSQIKAVRHENNLGKGQALKRGFAFAAGKRVAFLDADLDVHPCQLAGLLRRMDETDADVVISSKRHPESKLRYPFHRRLMSTVYFLWVKWMFGLPIRDTQTGLKLFKRSVLEQAFPKVLVKQFAYDLELLVIAHHLGFSIQESPVRLDYRRRFGRIGLGTVLDISWDTLAVFYRLKILRYYDYKEWDPWPRSQTPMVSVLVAVRGWDAYLEECLSGCLQLDYPRYEIIVLPDEPVEFKLTEESGGRVRFVPTGSVGPGEKRDQGARLARGELLAFLDSDAVPAMDWLTMAARHFQDPAVGGVGGPGVTPREDSFLKRASGHVYESWLGGGPARMRYTPDTLQEVDDFPSCNLIVRRKDFEAVGGFQTRYWPGEDTILCRGLVRHQSRKIIYDPRTVVFHHRRALFKEHLIQIKNYALHRGFFARRFPENSRRAAYFLPSFFVAGCALSWVPGLFFPFWKTLWVWAVGGYLLATFVASLTVRHLGMSGVVWLGLISTHVTYGIYFMKGLFSRDLVR